MRDWTLIIPSANSLFGKLQIAQGEPQSEFSCNISIWKDKVPRYYFIQKCIEMTHRISDDDGIFRDKEWLYLTTNLMFSSEGTT
jgi:hypothetical protein